MFIDTHCHLNMCIKKKFDVLLTPDELETARYFVERAQAVDVAEIINVGTSLPESINCVSLAAAHKNLWAAVGIHPNDCTENWRDDLAQLELYLTRKQAHKIVAIGECGLDKHYPGYDVVRQKEAFEAQIQLAKKYDCALIVHTRDAGEETLAVLEPHKNSVRAVIHCFSEDGHFAETVISWGFLLGIGGTITYPKNNDLRAIVAHVGPAHIVLETDSPFLPPQQLRGTQNSPANIPMIAAAIADLCQISPAELGAMTSANAERLFRFSAYRQ